MVKAASGENSYMDMLTAEGRECLESGDYEGALQIFSEAARLAAEHSDLPSQTAHLQAVAEIHRISGRIDEATETYETLLSVLEQLPDDSRKGAAYTNRALLEVKRKNYIEALAHFQRALAIFGRIGETLHAAQLWGNIGSIHRDQDRYQSAIESHHHALLLYEELGHIEGIADQYANIAYACAMDGRYQEAHGWFAKALPVYVEGKNTSKAQATRQNMDNLEEVLKGDQS
jgi:tetratricopeptide (TPR) repeat protein